MAKDLLDAVYGCLIGGAIGDALGAPVEGQYYTQIREKHGKLEEFISSHKSNTGADYGGSSGKPGVPGAVSDDTTFRHLMCLAMVRKGGRITPDDFAEVLLEKLNPNRVWVNERIVLAKLRIGMNPWETGRGTPPAGCASMAIAPVGIVNAGDPDQAYLDAFAIASLNQDGENRDAAATLAAGIAAAFLPEATVESVNETMREHSTYVIKRAIELSMELVHASRDVDQFAEKFYARMLDWTWPSRTWRPDHFFSGSSLEIVPIVMGILHLCKGDVNRCIIEGASFGRDCDTIANIAGEIAGAMQGAAAIRRQWIDQCEKANRDFFQEVEGDPDVNFRSMAERMVGILRSEKHRAAERARFLDRLLSTGC